MSLANKISTLRIALTPFFLIFLIYEAHLPAFIFFLLSALTDAIDGLVARKRREQTKIGSFIDPLADKTFLIPTYCVLTANGYLPKWLFVLLISRDFTILLGWLVYIVVGEGAKTLKAFARTSGKTAIALQMLFFGFMLLDLSLTNTNNLWFNKFLEVMLFTVGFATFVSFLDYLVLGSRKLGKFLS